MRVLVLPAGTEITPSTRLRVLAYLDSGHASGIHSSIPMLTGLPFIRQLDGFTRLLIQMPGYDVVLIQKRLFPLPVIYLIRLLARKLVFDFDDAIYVPPSNRKTSPLTMWTRCKRLSLLLRLSDLVIAGNAHLAQYARSYNARVEILATPVDTLSLGLKRESAVRAGPVVIGWIGTAASLGYLRQIAPILEQLGTSYGREVLLKVVCNEPFYLQGITVENKEWSIRDEPEDLNSFDIGIMPLSDDERTRGKCGYKLLQYMAVGLPVVCSPVGANREIVADGKEGFWATTQEEWFSKLSMLVTDRELRLRMGKQGRITVENRYSLNILAPRFVELLDRVDRS